MPSASGSLLNIGLGSVRYAQTALANFAQSIILNSIGNDGPTITDNTIRSHKWRITKLGPINIGSLKFAKELVLPNFNIISEEVKGGFLSYNFAKSVKWDDVIVRFYDTSKHLGELNAWKYMVVSDKDGIKIHNNYKQECSFMIFDTSDKQVEFKLHGAYPSSISHSEMSYSESGIKLITVVIKYDYADYVVDGVNTGSDEYANRQGTSTYTSIKND